MLGALMDKRCWLSSGLCSAASIRLLKHTGQWLLQEGEDQCTLLQLLRKGVVNTRKLLQLKILIKLIHTPKQFAKKGHSSMK